MLCKVVGGHEGEDVSLQTFEAWVVEDLDGRLFDGPVHSLGLTIRPRVIRLCQPVLDAVLGTDTIEDVGAEIPLRGSVPVLRQIGESHAIVGEYRVDFVGESFDDVPQEVSAVHLACVLMEFDISELRDPVDRQEHVEFAVSEPQLADIDVDVRRSIRN